MTVSLGSAKRVVGLRRLFGIGEHMTEGALESLPETANVRSLEVSSDDGRAFLSIERRMEIVKIINMHKSATVAEIVE